MAMEATHIRFALDLKDRYGVKDIEKYIFGSVYPDSRYITKIDRKLTHGDYLFDPAFAKDDFRKGWQAHWLCDIAQHRAQYKILPELNIHPKLVWTDEIWETATAIKIVEDIYDMQCFDIGEFVKYLDYADNPNGENIDDIKKYNRVIIDLYEGKKVSTVEDNYKLWRAFGVGKERCVNIKRKTEEFLNDKEFAGRIKLIYPEMNRIYEEILRGH